ncbi:ImmA/IrrE family metallo-endopeptidase [Candidatus Poribacteria bacterium]|nr:ImmA/IrrE family metallo-endopeptidase [Candidatus Poribacteria bacterium]
MKKAGLSEELGKRVAAARKRLKMNQEALAREAGFKSHQIISQIEKGRREVKVWELSALSRILRVEMSQLLGVEEPKSPAQVLWRQRPSTGIEVKEVEFLQCCERYHRLEQLCGIKSSDVLPQFKVDPARLKYSDVERIAHSVSGQMRLGSRPAVALERELEEKYGVKIWHMPIEDGSAASSKGDFGLAILMNSNEAPWRRNSSFAHELFHLITWDAVPPQQLREDASLWEHVEKMAEGFASHLLLPEQEVRVVFANHLDPENKTVSFTDIIEMAREFDVSTTMFLYRLRRLRLIKEEDAQKILADPDFRAQDKKTMRAHWWTPPEIPPRFVRLAYLAYKKGNLARAKLAEYLNVSLIDLSETLLDYGFDDSDTYDAQIHTDSGNS